MKRREMTEAHEIKAGTQGPHHTRNGNKDQRPTLTHTSQYRQHSSLRGHWHGVHSEFHRQRTGQQNSQIREKKTSNRSQETSRRNKHPEADYPESCSTKPHPDPEWRRRQSRHATVNRNKQVGTSEHGKCAQDHARAYNLRKRDWKPKIGDLLWERQHPLSKAAIGFAAHWQSTERICSAWTSSGKGS